MTVENNIEYEQAPSGHITFYNYKEPLMKFEKGYGFVGALIFDGVSKKLQCHLCGEWHAYLPNHIKKEHNMKADQYKDMVGLRRSTALLNEDMRATLIKNGLEKRMKNLRPGGSPSKEVREKIRQTLKENRAEAQNVNNTCPEQLITRLQNLHKKLGRTPTRAEMPFEETLVRVYGSISNACKIAGIPPRKSGSSLSKEMGLNKKYPRVACLEWVRNFYESHARLPENQDFVKRNKRGMYEAIRKIGKISLYKDAVSVDGIYRKTTSYRKIKYDKNELLKFLRTFEKINGRKPSYSDCKRGPLPHLSRYSYNFGSWKNALKLAFPQ